MTNPNRSVPTNINKGKGQGIAAGNLIPAAQWEVSGYEKSSYFFCFLLSPTHFSLLFFILQCHLGKLHPFLVAFLRW